MVMHNPGTRNNVEDMFGKPGDPRSFQREREQYIEWLAIPPNRREPASQEKMAKALGVTSDTLRNWKRDPRIISKVKGRIQGVIALNDLASIVETLKEQAFDASNPRSVQAAKVLIEMMEKGESRQADVPLTEMSNEELRKLAAELHDAVDERTA